MLNINNAEPVMKSWYKDAYALSGIVTAIFSPLMGFIAFIIGYFCGSEHSGKVMVATLLSLILSFTVGLLL